MHQGVLKACEACKSSKRKCTKQLPKCRRCELRGLSCGYESRPRIVVYQPNTDGPEVHQAWSDDGSLRPTSLGLSTFPDAIATDPELNTQAPSPQSSVCASLDDLRSAWFLSPESWAIAPLDPSRLASITVTGIHKCLDQLKEWLGEWVTIGSNPFIHPELYCKSTPGCIQDAFMVISTYRSKTEKTADMVHRFIEAKSDELVASQAASTVVNDTLGQIARVQALLVYSVIRLFDGNIRQRYAAERHLSTLYDWTRQMILHISGATKDDTFLLHNALTDFIPRFTSDPPMSRQSSPEQLLWHAWILAESIRRTWYMTMFVHSAYELLKTGSGPCHGSLPVTTKRGVWEAKTAFAWIKLCADGNIGLFNRNETERLIAERNIDEVDVFALAIMELDFGSEGMDRWQLGLGC